jgi:sporulation protein YlmC with PRC-barrel domain
MLRGISNLGRFTIAATDGDLGRVGDVYFDDRSWDVRYLAVDAGDWLSGRRVLVSPAAVQTSDTTLRVALTRRQLGVEPANPGRVGESAGAHLQTATAVMGYTVHAEDGEIGHVADVLVDDRAWAIRYLLVAPENQRAGKRVLVAPAWLTHVAWDASKTLCCIATAIADGIGSGGDSKALWRARG